MKKVKPVSLHNIQSTSLSLSKKKSPSSAKQKVSKSPGSKKSIQTYKTSSQPEDYIIINDSIYSANTFTERNCYDQFLTKIKRDKQQTRKSFLIKQTLQVSQAAKLRKGKQNTKKKFKKLAPEDLIKCMSLDEKREMFYRLQSEITSSSNNGVTLPIDLPSLSQNNKQSQPCSTQSFQNDMSSRMRQDSERQRFQKFRLLQQKLQRIKMELIFKWESQLEKLQDLFAKGRINEKQKQNKKIIIEKLKDHKLKIIQCTKTLFQKILQQEDTNNNCQELTQKKNDKIEAILQSLHSLPSLESLKDEEIEREPNIDHLKVNNQKLKMNQNQLAFSSQTSLQQLSERQKEVQQASKEAQNEPNFHKKSSLDNNKKKIITSMDSGPLEIVEENGHGAFLSDFNEDIQSKKIKIREQLVSPLNFMNTSPKNKGFGQIEEIKSVVNTGVAGVPSKSEQMLRELLDLGDFSKQKKQVPNQFMTQNGQNAKFSLKLDLRLDEVVLGQDQYSHCEKDSQSQEKSHEQNTSYEISFDAKIDELINNENSQIQSATKPKTSELRFTKSDKKAKKRSLIQFSEEDEPQKCLSSDRVSSKSISSLTKISLKKLQQNTVFERGNNIQNEPIISAQRHIVQQQSESQEDRITAKFELQLSLKEKPSIVAQSLPLPLPQPKQETSHVESAQQPKQSHQEDQSLDQLQCHEVSHNVKPTIDIPMLLSKEKMETLAIEQNRMFRENVDRRIAFQMGCIEPQSPQFTAPHFTTLVDINSYIVGLYEFMMKKYMSSLVDSLNIPYGKSAIDKLYSIHTEGFVLEQSYNQMNNILSQTHFKEYQREMTLTVRKCSEYETAHNRAVFQAFTKAINVYRPYYQLQGEVFPWIVSEKGITFYQITEDNIEEVFEKSKIKVLEYCTSLCGIHPPTEVKNDEQSAIVNNKNQENLSKIIKTQTLQQFDEWKIRFVNFDCLVRILLGKLIIADLINQATQEFNLIAQKKQAVID